MSEQVLIIAPHPDDETLGCGGTVSQLVDDGAAATAVFLTSGELGLRHLQAAEARRVREAEAVAAAAILGIGELRFLRLPDWELGGATELAGRLVAEVLNEVRPTVVFAPHDRDGHPDHAVSLKILRVAVSQAAVRPPDVRCYEVWTPIAEPDEICDVTATMRRKLRALRAHASQLGTIRYDRAVAGLNAYRGALNRRGRYAEAFLRVSATDEASS